MTVSTDTEKSRGGSQMPDDIPQPQKKTHAEKEVDVAQLQKSTGSSVTSDTEHPHKNAAGQASG